MLYHKWSNRVLSLTLIGGVANLLLATSSWGETTSGLIGDEGTQQTTPVVSTVQGTRANVQRQAVETEGTQPGYGAFVNSEGLPVEQRSHNLQKQNNSTSLVQTTSQSQPRTNQLIVPSADGEIIADIQVRFVDEQGQPTEGTTRPVIITREFELQPGDIYRSEQVQQGLQRVRQLEIVKEANLSLVPTVAPNQVVMVVNVVERSSFRVTAFPGSSRAKGFYGVLRLEELNLGGNNQSLALRLEGGERTLGFDLSFTSPWILGDPNRTGYSVGVFNQRSPSNVFIGGDRDVDLPNGETPWVHRLGGEGEVFRPIAPDWRVGAGLSYERVSVRDDAFTNKVQPVDELGNQLTFSDGGQDDLVTVNLSAIQDRRNDDDYPTQGSKLTLGMNQSIPIGDGNILFNRLSGSYTQYVPVEVFGFSAGSETFVFNLQGGTTIGDLPPYEAFTLGGGDSVRGYKSGDVAAGRSFVQATAEYRFPVFSWLGGAVFADYATDLGSGDTVPGEPGEVRDKPGSGFGYGVGVRVRSPLGPVQVDFGINDQGDNQVHFRLGERF
ncbi:MAG TPA: BamA/TamA family outer membrane protein [Coleofasciculaceae cyanobacterium]